MDRSWTSVGQWMAALVFVVAGCGSDADSSSPDAGTGAPIDAAPLPDVVLPAVLSCYGAVPGPTAPDPVSMHVNLSATSTRIFSGVAVEARRFDDDSVITSGTTDANGVVALSLPTGGVPLAAYLHWAPDGDQPYNWFFSGPLSQATNAVYGQNDSTDTEVADALTAGVTMDPSLGEVAATVTDCRGVGRAGVVASYSTDQRTYYYGSGDSWDLSADSTSTSAFVETWNVPVGPLTMTLDYGHGWVVSYPLKSFAGEFSYLNAGP